MASSSTSTSAHLKYFEVVNTKIVKAPNMAEAQRLSRLSRSANVLDDDTFVVRITANAARELLAEG